MRYLQDAINGYAQYGKTMSEELIMMYTIELLRMVDALHTCGVIHGDIKPDNFLIRNASKCVVVRVCRNWVCASGVTHRSTHGYFLHDRFCACLAAFLAAIANIFFCIRSLPDGEWEPDGANGWSSCGLQLIDFGRSLDYRCAAVK